MSQSKDTFPKFIAREDPNSEPSAPEGSFRDSLVSLKGIPYVSISTGNGQLTADITYFIDPISFEEGNNQGRGLETAAVMYAKAFNSDLELRAVDSYVPANELLPVVDFRDEYSLRSLTTVSLPYGWGGNALNQYVRLDAATFQNQSAAQKTAPAQVTIPGTWSITDTPAANTQATVSKPAEELCIHVCTAITATLVAPAGSVSDTVQLNLRDGATGTGTILKSFTLQVGGADSISADRAIIQLSGLQVVGSNETDMTLEFSAAGGTNVLESVSLEGYTLFDLTPEP